jgi:hypothetical protein
MKLVLGCIGAKISRKRVRLVAGVRERLVLRRAPVTFDDLLCCRDGVHHRYLVPLCNISDGEAAI